MTSTNAYEHPQPHACFIQSVSDSLVGGNDSIMGLWNREALLFKYGSGTGSNFSNIRGSGEPFWRWNIEWASVIPKNWRQGWRAR